MMTWPCYLTLHVALLKDNLEDAKKRLGEVALHVTEFHPRGPDAARNVWKKLGHTISQRALTSCLRTISRSGALVALFEWAHTPHSG